MWRRGVQCARVCVHVRSSLAACRLREVVFENALVIQGNSSDELPEQILGCARLYRFDFERMRPFEDFMTQPPPPPPATLGHGVPPAIPEGAPHEREDDDDA